MSRNDGPYSGSHGRTCWYHRLLYEKFRRIVESEMLAPGDTVLDYGCGSRPYRALFNVKFKRYIGADLQANVEADVIIDPEGRLPCRDASVECVLSSQVLEHTEDPSAYLQEAHRVLKRDGALVVSAPAVW